MWLPGMSQISPSLPSLVSSRLFPTCLKVKLLPRDSTKKLLRKSPAGRSMDIKALLNTISKPVALVKSSVVREKGRKKK